MQGIEKAPVPYARAPSAPRALPVLAKRSGGYVASALQPLSLSAAGLRNFLLYILPSLKKSVPDYPL